MVTTLTKHKLILISQGYTFLYLNCFLIIIVFRFWRWIHHVASHAEQPLQIDPREQNPKHQAHTESHESPCGTSDNRHFFFSLLKILSNMDEVLHLSQLPTPQNADNFATESVADLQKQTTRYQIPTTCFALKIHHTLLHTCWHWSIFRSKRAFSCMISCAAHM